jgi:hypothetical protein
MAHSPHCATDGIIRLTFIFGFFDEVHGFWSGGKIRHCVI